jgi:hypothetical protein
MAVQNSATERLSTQALSANASHQFEELQLIRRSQAGDADAFGKLLTKYRFKIFAMVCGIVGNELPRTIILLPTNRKLQCRHIRNGPRPFILF